MSARRSKTVTAQPRRRSVTAAESPAGPAPMTAARRPFSAAGGRGTTQPRSNAVSTIRFSDWRTITDSSSSWCTQDASQSAGQTRDVNSGKSDRRESSSQARRQSPCATARFWSGTRFPSGHPAPWQNGCPQFMQRATCSRTSPSASGRSTSRQSRVRSSTGR